MNSRPRLRRSVRDCRMSLCSRAARITYCKLHKWQIHASTHPVYCIRVSGCSRPSSSFSGFFLSLLLLRCAFSSACVRPECMCYRTEASQNTIVLEGRHLPADFMKSRCEQAVAIRSRVETHRRVADAMISVRYKLPYRRKPARPSRSG